MIQLVVSDLDGTLLNPGGILPAAALDMARELRRRGVGFTIASGRAAWFIRPIESQLELTLPYIACNGASIIRQGTALMRESFPISAVKLIEREAASMGYSFVYTIEGEERVTTVTDWLRQDAEKHGRRYVARPFTETEWGKLRAEKAMLYDPGQDGGMVKLEALCQRMTDLRCVRYAARSIELSPARCSKASGLKKLLELLAIPPKDVLVIADDQNDIEILRLAGIGAVVANGTPDAKAAADYICKRDHFAGVYEAVRRFCLPPEAKEAGV